MQAVPSGAWDPEPEAPAPAAGGARPVPQQGPRCTCRHSRTAHQHHRRGTDCALCSCTRYTGPLARLLPWRH